MRSSFMGLSTLLRALQAQQTAMDVTNQNIANANTDGYTRQNAVFAQTPGHGGSGNNRPVGSGLMLGTGVMVQEITRQRDAFVEKQLRTQTALQQKFQISSDGLAQVETIFNEPSTTGISAQLTNFFNSWSQLSTNPGSATARAQLQMQGQTLASTFRDASNQLDQLRTDQDNQLMSVVSEVNDLATRVAGLNLDIRRSTAVGDHPNDLLDARDRLLDSLTKLTGATYTERTDGSATVQIGGRILVDGTRANAIMAELTPLANGKASHTLTWWPNPGVVTGLSGTVGGLLNVRDTVIGDKLTKLNLLASTIVSGVNAQHAKGMGLGSFSTTTLGTEFFDTQRTTTKLLATGLGDTLTRGTITIGTTIITVDPINKSMNDVLVEIATALGSGSATIDATTGRVVLTSTTPPTIGAGTDTSNFLQVTGIRGAGTTLSNGTYTTTGAFAVPLIRAGSLSLNATVAADAQAIRASGTTTNSAGVTISAGSGDNSNALAIAGLARTQWASLGTSSIDDYYASMIGSLGVESRQATQMASSQKALVDHLISRRESTSGVNLDEEAAQLIRFQRAYQAAARGITAVDDMLSQVINSMGRVGL